MEHIYLRGPWGVTSDSKLWLSACAPYWLPPQTSHLGALLSRLSIMCLLFLSESDVPKLWWLASSPALSFPDRHSRMVHLHCLLSHPGDMLLGLSLGVFPRKTWPRKIYSECGSSWIRGDLISTEFPSYRFLVSLSMRKHPSLLLHATPTAMPPAMVNCISQTLSEINLHR